MKLLEALKFWDKKEQITGFAAIDSLGKAHLMVDKGMLEPIFLKEVRFGGNETPENRVYVPIGIAKIKKHHDDEIEKLIEERNEARANKNWAKADEIRDKLKEMNIVLKDTPTGVQWSYIE